MTTNVSAVEPVRPAGAPRRGLTVAGWTYGEAAWNKWHADIRLCGYSLLIDPAQGWRPEIGPFVEGGDPVGGFEQSCRRLRVPIATFPFTASGFIVHLGRGTLAGVYERRETSNVFFDWAADHHEPHFQQVPQAQARYSALREEFDGAVGDLQPEQLVGACRRTAAQPERSAE